MIERALRYCAGKVPMWTIPLDWLKGFARVMFYGGKKYDYGNYRKGAPSREHIGCALRHLMPLQAWAESPDDITLCFDPESWCCHTGHIMANAAFLHASIAREAGIEDDYDSNPNPPKPGDPVDYAAFLDEMEKRFGREVREKSFANALLAKQQAKQQDAPIVVTITPGAFLGVIENGVWTLGAPTGTVTYTTAGSEPAEAPKRRGRPRKAKEIVIGDKLPEGVAINAPEAKDIIETPVSGESQQILVEEAPVRPVQESDLSKPFPLPVHSSWAERSDNVEEPKQIDWDSLL